MIKENAIINALPLGKPKKSIDIAGFLKRYGLYVILLGSLLFACLLPLLFILKKQNYEVHAFLKLDPVIPTLITRTDESSIVNYYQDYANTLAHSMTTVDVLAKTVDRLGKADRKALFPAGLSSEKCAELLALRLTVSPVKGTHLLDISISGEKSLGLAPLLNTLMRVYIEEDRNNSTMVDNDRLKYLYDQKAALNQDIAMYERSLDSLARDISTSTYAEGFNRAGQNNEEMSRIYDKLLSDRITSEARYREAVRTAADLRSVSLKPLVDEMVMADPSLHFTDSWTYQQLQELRSTTDGLTSSNPDRIYVEQRMAAMKNYDQKLRDEVRKTARGVVNGKHDIEMRKEIILARNGMEKAKKVEADFRKEVDANMKESKRISLGIRRGESLTTYLKHKHDLLDNIDTRITEIEVERKAPLRLSIESVARTPKVPMKSNFKTLALGFVGASFGSVAAFFLLVEFLDDRIRTARDVASALGYPPTQVIGDVRRKARAGGPQCDLAPVAFSSEAIGSLAIRLCREQAQSGSRILLFTGLEHGAGVTSIAGSCALALSKIVERVLVIDGNIGVPAMASGANPAGASGLGGYLVSGGDWKAYVERSAEGNLDSLPPGVAPATGMPRQRLRALLEEAGRSYDFVCIDASPLLESHLTEQLAIYADIVLLISLQDSSHYPDLRRSAELLVQLGVPGIAPILNQAGARTRISLDDLTRRPPKAFVDKLPAGIAGFLHKLAVRLRKIDRIVDDVQGS